MKIPFNKPFFIGNETKYISQAVKSGKISGDGKVLRKNVMIFSRNDMDSKSVVNDILYRCLRNGCYFNWHQRGDEIIMPSYTFVSTANAFVLRGAKIVFSDSNSINPNIDTDTIESLITSKTKAIVVVHYAGISCDMDAVMTLSKKYNLLVIEDAAQAIDSFYKGRPLGSIGHLAKFLFHETKNIISGRGRHAGC